MSKPPIAWYRTPSEDAPDGDAVYGPRDPNMAGMDTGWLPAYAHGEDVPPELFAQQIAAAMRYADAPLSHDQFVTLVLYLKARGDGSADNAPHDGRTAASSPGVPLDAVVGPREG